MCFFLLLHLSQLLAQVWNFFLQIQFTSTPCTGKEGNAFCIWILLNGWVCCPQMNKQIVPNTTILFFSKMQRGFADNMVPFSPLLAEVMQQKVLCSVVYQVTARRESSRVSTILVPENMECKLDGVTKS